MRIGPRELLLFLIVLLLPVAAYFGAIGPQNAKIERDKTELTLMRDLLDKLRAETARTSDLAAENERIEETVSSIEDRLPSGKEVDEIVRQVSVLAVESGLAPPELKSSKPLAAAHYREQPLELKTSGPWEGYYDFMLRLERLPRITRLSDMSVARAREGESLEVEFTLSIYFLDEDAEVSS